MTVADSETYFRWRASEQTPSVALSRAVMSAIEREVLNHFEPRGEAVAGMLLGRRDQETADFVIHEFEPLRAGWQENWRWLRDEASPRLMGIYRSQTRPGFAVAPDDCELVEQFLPRQQGVLLLVKPLSASECIGKMFLCDGGMVVDEAASGREFAMGGTPRPAARAAKPKWLRVLAPATAVAVGASIGLMIHYRHSRGAEESPASFAPVFVAEGAPEAQVPLALKAVAEGSLIHLSWNTASPAVASATGAVLTVADGDARQSVQLRQADLRRGELNWRAAARAVTFRIEVPRAGAPPLIETASAEVAPASIKSPSASRLPEPSIPARASAATSEQSPRRYTQMTPAHSRGRVKRIFGGITSKASHLWPFHSAKQQ